MSDESTGQFSSENNPSKKGHTNNPGGRPKKPAGLATMAENAMFWVDDVVSGRADAKGREALRTALEEAWRLGNSLPQNAGLPEVMAEEVERLLVKHLVAIMVARVSEKADLVRLRGAIDLMDRHYGKAQASVEVTGEGMRVTTVTRVIVDGAEQRVLTGEVAGERERKPA